MTYSTRSMCTGLNPTPDGHTLCGTLDLDSTNFSYTQNLQYPYVVCVQVWNPSPDDHTPYGTLDMDCTNWSY